MNIVHAALRYHPAIGGVENYVRDVCQGLAARGHSVHTFTSDLDQHTLRSYLMEAPCEAEIRGVRVTRLHASFLPLINSYPWISRLSARLFEAPATLLHGHSFYYSAADVAALVARRKLVPFVFNPYYYPPRGVARRLYHSTIGRLTMAADVVITISRWERSLIEKVGFRIKRFESVPPGINTAVFGVARRNVYARFGIDIGNARILLFVGRLAPEKGIDTLIEALPSVLKSEPEVVLAIVGPDAGSREALEAQAQRSQIAHRVLFLGALSREDLLSAYQDAAVFVFPSRYEAFGIVLIEAMASGLPIVASNAAAISSVVPDGEAGFLCGVDDARSFAANIVHLLRDDDQRIAFSNYGREHVERNYSLELQLDRLEEIYRSVVEAGADGR